MSNRHLRHGLIALAIFLLALGVRLPQLDASVTADETVWVARSHNFLMGILDPTFQCDPPAHDTFGLTAATGWACTLQAGHPGVLTMWSGATGLVGYWLYANPDVALIDFLTSLPVERLNRAILFPVRLPGVLLSALFVTAVYLLTGKLFRAPIPLLTALLLALNPFHIALTRVLHHDALATGFMVTAALTTIIYYAVDPGRRWLVFAGVLSGLAFLSKSTGLFLLPYTALIALWATFVPRAPYSQQQQWRNLALDALVWASAAFGMVLALWPAMWVIPAQALQMVLGTGFNYAGDGHPTGGFFWGQVWSDPGPWFYPLTWLFRTNPWALLGLLLAIIAAGWTLPRFRRIDWTPLGFNHRRGLLLWVAAFVGFFLLAMTLGHKKGDRYLLPVYPMLDLVAAVGLWTFFKRWHAAWLATGILLVNLVLMFNVAPYYLSYYNPVLGGGPLAATVLPIGWGEGLDQAAAYLNQQPNTQQMRVAAWYSGVLAPYFAGATEDLAGNQPAYTADYTVFYINQVQRGFPSTDLLTYFAQRQPNHTVTLNGIDYAWIYQGPLLDDQPPVSFDQPLNHPLNPAITLLGIDLPLGEMVTVGEQSELPLTIFWQVNQALPPNLNVGLRLRDATGHIWGQVDRLPLGGLVRTQDWEPGTVVRDDYRIALDPGIRPGDYTFEVLWYDFTDDQIFATVEEVGQFMLHPAVNSLQGDATNLPNTQQTNLGNGLALVGHTVVTKPYLPGGRYQLRLYWQSTAPLDTDGVVTLLLADNDGQRWSLGEFSLGIDATDPRTYWQAGQIVGLPLDIALPVSLPSGNYQLWLAHGETEALIGQLQIDAPVLNTDLPADLTLVPATFGPEADIKLHGYQLAGSETGAVLTLYWQAESPLRDDYKIFIHLLDDAGQIVAQRDAMPLDGSRPTTTWRPGEVIADPHPLPPVDTPSTMWLGLYHPETGQRLSICSDLPVSQDRLRVGP